MVDDNLDVFDRFIPVLFIVVGHISNTGFNLLVIIEIMIDKCFLLNVRLANSVNSWL